MFLNPELVSGSQYPIRYAKDPETSSGLKLIDFARKSYPCAG